MIIFDIDGVLADSNWRTKKYLNEKNINWQAYFDDAIYDIPIQSGILIAKAFINFLPQTEILFLTGRRETVRNETLAWLSEQLQIEKNKIDLTMRPIGNYIESVKFKEEVGREIGFKNIDLVFEDNPKIVSMWRKHGVPCYQTCEYAYKT